jgi:hypothetical protein
MSLGKYGKVVAAVAEMYWLAGHTVATAVAHAEEFLLGLGVCPDREDLEEYVRSVWYVLAEKN